MVQDDKIHIFNNNFYDNWNNIFDEALIEFILPLENIETIQNINKNKNELINLEVNYLLKEYSKKNLALIIIEDNTDFKKIYTKSIQGKKYS